MFNGAQRTQLHTIADCELGPNTEIQDSDLIELRLTWGQVSRRRTNGQICTAKNGLKIVPKSVPKNGPSLLKCHHQGWRPGGEVLRAEAGAGHQDHSTVGD